MKIVVIGGTGLIGSKVVSGLRAKWHEVVAASPNTGVNTLTGEGLDAALAGAKVVVDVSNSPSFAGNAAIEFFETAGRNIAEAERKAGVEHHVALSVVGTERLLASTYFQGKLAQEALIKASAVPYTILRSTQFFPFVSGIVEGGTVGEEVRLSPALVQPIAADDVAEAMVEIALSPPVNGTVEIAGPEAIRLDAFAAEYLSAKADGRRIVADPHALYFGAELDDRSLTPGAHPRLGKATFGDWLREQISPD